LRSVDQAPPALVDSPLVAESAKPEPISFDLRELAAASADLLASPSCRASWFTGGELELQQAAWEDPQ
jgi:hypothetical protein